jgi:hypothetical protein
MSVLKGLLLYLSALLVQAKNDEYQINLSLKDARI